MQLTDSTGNVTLAPLVFVSAGQINYQVPSSGVAQGLVSVTVLNDSGIVASGVIEVASIAPTIFTANSSGSGVAAAQIERFTPGSTQPTYEDVFTYDSTSGQFVGAPIAFNGDSLYLLLYGTGFDAASGAGGTTVTTMAGFLIGPTLSVQFSGPQGQYAGLDQIVAPLPDSLAGSGQVTLNVTVDGATANPVTISFQ